MTASLLTASTLLVLVAVAWVGAHPVDYHTDEQISAVIPSPNQDMAEQPTSASKDSSAISAVPVPIYVSPYVRSERGVRHVGESFVETSPKYTHKSPAAHAPLAPAPQPEEETISYEPAKPSGRDLKSAASYGHGHHHGGGHGWLDMGAWTGPKGSFGWYADYPVGKKHGGHY